jgi:hypothetical protein
VLAFTQVISKDAGTYLPSGRTDEIDPPVRATVAGVGIHGAGIAEIRETHVYLAAAAVYVPLTLEPPTHVVFKMLNMA